MLYADKVDEWADELSDLAALLREADPERCCVRGDPPLGNHEGPLTCELPGGHDGYHKAGTISWLGYHVATELRKAEPPYDTFNSGAWMKRALAAEDDLKQLRALLRKVSQNANYVDENYQRVPVGIIDEVDAVAGKEKVE